MSIPYSGGLHAEQQATSQMIFRACTEKQHWRTLFAARRLASDLPVPQRHALILAAAWRLALVNVRRLSRKRIGWTPIAIGHDLHLILRGRGFDRLDCERIAVDALHVLRQGRAHA